VLLCVQESDEDDSGLERLSDSVRARHAAPGSQGGGGLQTRPSLHMTGVGVGVGVGTGVGVRVMVCGGGVYVCIKFMIASVPAM